MEETAGSILRRFTFRGSVLAVSFGTIHMAEKIHASVFAHPTSSSGLEILLADDDLILNHGARAWGAFMGLRQDQGAGAEMITAADALKLRISAVVDDGTAAVAEAAMELGQTEYENGKWSEDGLLAYTSSILEIDAQIRGQTVSLALGRQNIPEDMRVEAARVVTTVFMSSAGIPHAGDSVKTGMMVESPGRAPMEIGYDAGLHTVLADISQRIYGLNFMIPSPDSRPASVFEF